MKILLSTATALVLALPLSAQTPEATIDRAVKAYSKVKTARASFEQTLTNPLTGNTQVARGELQQRTPGRLAITFTDPKGDRIVNDGRAVWVYTPSSAPGQVIKLSPAAGGPMSRIMRANRTSTPATVSTTRSTTENPSARYSGSPGSVAISSKRRKPAARAARSHSA